MPNILRENMKVYTVYNGKLYSATVIKETKCFYMIDSLPQFIHLTRIVKEQAHLSALSAIQCAYSCKKSTYTKLEDKLISLRAEIKLIEKLGDELSKHNN